MLAKELKIKNLKKQREFIEERLDNLSCNQDGDTSYGYVGNVFPEVVAYFQAKGYSVQKHSSERMIALTKGLPVYIFTACDVELSPDELKEANNHEPEFSPFSAPSPDSVMRTMVIPGGISGGMPDSLERILRDIGIF